MHKKPRLPLPVVVDTHPFLPEFDGRAGFDEVPIAQRVTHTDPHRVDTCRCSRHKFNQLRVLLRRSRVDGYFFEQWRIVDNVPAP